MFLPTRYRAKSFPSDSRPWSPLPLQTPPKALLRHQTKCPCSEGRSTALPQQVGVMIFWDKARKGLAEVAWIAPRDSLNLGQVQCSQGHTINTGLFIRSRETFFKRFSESSPYLLGQHGSCSSAKRPGELSENILENLSLTWWITLYFICFIVSLVNLQYMRVLHIDHTL